MRERGAQQGEEQSEQAERSDEGHGGPQNGLVAIDMDEPKGPMSPRDRLKHSYVAPIRSRSLNIRITPQFQRTLGAEDRHLENNILTGSGLRHVKPRGA